VAWSWPKVWANPVDFALQVPIVGCWLALEPATVENGCMRILRGGHRAGRAPRLLPHHQRR
jgi:ectoine hydroxylase-related dioxygenase (phytanoyl-CoA dioxygenase family)